jgi:hypothetical protein
MNRASVLIMAFLLASSAANALPSLNDQINAVDDVEQQNDAQERAAQQAYQQHLYEEQQAEHAIEAKWRETELNLQRQKAAEAYADKKRDQDYDDQLRAFDIQEKTLKLQAEKTRVARENDYIDQELKEKAANTDVIKSKADATRDVSSGTKTLLEKTGEADVKSQSGVFR